MFFSREGRALPGQEDQVGSDQTLPHHLTSALEEEEEKGEEAKKKKLYS